MPYTVRLINDPRESGTEINLFPPREKLSRRERESANDERESRVLSANPHIVHNRASRDCKAVSRSFPYGFHLPSLQSNFNMFSVRELQKRTKEIPSINYLNLQASAHRPTIHLRLDPPL